MDKETINLFISGTFWFIIGFLVTAIILSSCSGCGYQRALREKCHLEGQTCDTLFGVNQYEVDEKQNEVDKQLSAEIQSIKTTLDNLIADIRFIQSQILANNALLNMLKADINSNSTLIEALEQNTFDLEARLDYQQVIVNNHQIQLTQLATEDNIVEYYDACGNGPGFDEVILRARSGKLLAYFESGSDRFLTVLQKNVSYRTTDQQKCYFTVDNLGQIVNEHL